MTKIAMRKIYDNRELRDLGFKMLIQVHDEVIGECPEENAEKAAEILTKVMKESVADTVKVPFKCDPDISPCWYYTDYKDTLQKDYDSLLKKGLLKQDALNEIIESHTECTKEQIIEFLEIKD